MQIISKKVVATKNPEIEIKTAIKLKIATLSNVTTFI